MISKLNHINLNERIMEIQVCTIRLMIIIHITGGKKKKKKKIRMLPRLDQITLIALGVIISTP